MVTLDDALNITEEALNKMTQAELKAVTQKLVYTANARIERFEKKGIESPALKDKPHFKTRGMTLNQLRGQYAAAKNFLSYETSTISGYREHQRKTVSRMLGTDVSTKEAQHIYEHSNMDKLWQAYERHRDKIESTAMASSHIQKALLQKATDSTTTADFDQMIEDLLQEETASYEAEQEQFNQLFDSEFTEISYDDEDDEYPW